MDSIQSDLDANYPDLEIDIIGMNQISHESGNANVTEGRDIPWLQDVDANNDGTSDVWLTSWPYAYRDVVIVDANNQVVEAYNLTQNNLAEGEKYTELTNKLLDAVMTLDLTNDVYSAMAGAPIDLPVLANDGSNDLQITNISDTTAGTLSAVDVSYPADLAPQSPAADLVISEVRPGEYIELFNYTVSTLDLESVTQHLVSGSDSVAVSDLSNNDTIPARSYLRLDWPANFSDSLANGELALFRDDASGFNDPVKLQDYVMWGSGGSNSHKTLAENASYWSGSGIGSITQGSIHRQPGTRGTQASDYNATASASPDAALNNSMQTAEIIRFTPNQSFSGQVQFTYTAQDSNGVEGTADVSVDVSAAAKPYQNMVEKLDVNADGHVVLQDALLVVNALNRGLGGAIDHNPMYPFVAQPFLDCNGSNSIELLDALLVINALNAQAEAEPEAEAEGEPADEPVSAMEPTATPSTVTDPAGSDAPIVINEPSFAVVNQYFASLDDDDDLSFLSE